MPRGGDPMQRDDEKEREDEQLHEESRAAIEQLQSDPRVQAVLEQMDRFAETGEDPLIGPVPTSEPAPASGVPAAADSEEELEPGQRREHWDGVRPAKGREMPQPDEKVVIAPQRTLSQIAEDAGISLGEFKQLKPGNRRARTQLAMKIVKQAEPMYADAPRTVGGHTARLGHGSDIVQAAAQAAGVSEASFDDGFHPQTHTVGGQTLRNIPPAGQAPDGAAAAGAAAAGAIADHSSSDGVTGSDPPASSPWHGPEADGELDQDLLPSAQLRSTSDAPSSAAPSMGTTRDEMATKKRRSILIAAAALVAVLLLLLLIGGVGGSDDDETGPAAVGTGDMRAPGEGAVAASDPPSTSEPASDATGASAAGGSAPATEPSATETAAAAPTPPRPSSAPTKPSASPTTDPTSGGPAPMFERKK